MDRNEQNINNNQNVVIQRNPRRDFSICGLAMLSFLGVSFVIQILMAPLLVVIHMNMGIFTISNTLAWYAVGVPVCYVIFRLVPVEKSFYKEKWSIGKLLIYFVVAVGMMYIGNYISQFLVFAAQKVTGIGMENPLDSMLSDATLLFQIGIVVLLAPIVEELICRKFLIDRIRIYGQGIAVLVSGVSFGLIHGNLYQAIYAFLLGAILAYIYVKTEKIHYCIIFHIIINFIGSVIPLGLQKILDMDVLESGNVDAIIRMGPQLTVLFLYLLIIFGCMIASIILVICFRKRITFLPGRIRILKGYRFQTVVLNVGAILFLLACAFLFILTITLT